MSARDTPPRGNISAITTWMSSPRVEVVTLHVPAWGYVKASNTGAMDGFGSDVALSADDMTLAAGAYQEASSAKGTGGDQADDSMSRAGAVYLFALDREP